MLDLISVNGRFWFARQGIDFELWLEVQLEVSFIRYNKLWFELLLCWSKCSLGVHFG